jgi:hypothetical protein
MFTKTIRIQYRVFTGLNRFAANLNAMRRLPRLAQTSRANGVAVCPIVARDVKVRTIGIRPLPQIEHD